MKITFKTSLLVALVALLGGAAAWVASSSAFERSSGGKRPSVSISVNDSPLARETKLSSSFAPVAKRVAPTVVNVFTTKTVRNQIPGFTPFLTIRFSAGFSGSRLATTEGAVRRRRSRSAASVPGSS